MTGELGADDWPAALAKAEECLAPGAPVEPGTEDAAAIPAEPDLKDVVLLLLLGL
jgi:hypothetical protein